MKRLLEKKSCVKGMFMAVAACILVFAMSIDVLAASGKVTATSAKIRKEASTSSDVVGTASKGDTVTIASEVNGTDGKVWYQVVTKDGATGYIRSDLLSKSESSSSSSDQATVANVTVAEPQVECEPVSGKVNNTKNAVRVRSNASTKDEIVTSVKGGTAVTVVGTSTDGDGKIWYLVNFSLSGKDVSGYIRYDYLTVDGEIIDKSLEAEEPAEEPVEEPEPIVEYKDYDTVLEGDTWYLYDYNKGEKIEILPMLETVDNAVNLKNWYNESVKKNNTFKGLVFGLGALAVVLGGALAFVIFKMRDMNDEEYVNMVEDEAKKRRTDRNRQVMQTVGEGHKINSSEETRKPQSVRPGTSNRRPDAGMSASARPAGVRPAGVRPTGQKPIEVKDLDYDDDDEIFETRPKKNVTSDYRTRNFVSKDDFELDYLNMDSDDDNQ